MQSFKQTPKVGESGIVIPSVNVKPKQAFWATLASARKVLEPTDYLLILRDNHSRDFTISAAVDGKDFVLLGWINNVFVIDPTSTYADALKAHIENQMNLMTVLKNDFFFGTYQQYLEKINEDETTNFMRHFSPCVMSYQRIVGQIQQNANAGLLQHSEFEDV